MRRINVTGNAGAGKSTLARTLSRLLSIELVHLDRIVWQPGWRKTPHAERAILERQVLTRPCWIVDGVSPAVREAADTIIFLDFPRRTVAWRCAKRNWRYLFRSRPELPANCPELSILPTLARLIWRFPRFAKPAILADFSRWQGHKTLVHIRSQTQLEAFLSNTAILESTKRVSLLHPHDLAKPNCATLKSEVRSPPTR